MDMSFSSEMICYNKFLIALVSAIILQFLPQFQQLHYTGNIFPLVSKHVTELGSVCHQHPCRAALHEEGRHEGQRAEGLQTRDEGGRVDGAADQPGHQELLHHSGRLGESGGDESGDQEEALILNDVSSKASETIGKVSGDAPVKEAEETVLVDQFEDVSVEPEVVLLPGEFTCEVY